MKIIKTMNAFESYDVATIYEMTKGPNHDGIKDHDGERFHVIDFCHYVDEKDKELLTLMTEEGIIMTTNSKTAIADFFDVYDMYLDFGHSGGSYEIGIYSGTAKSGRTFYGIRI